MMNTLMQAPLSALLDRLFADAEASTARVQSQIQAIPEAQRAAMMADKEGYLDLYTWMKDAHLAVSRETGRLLYMLARSSRARNIVEFGTSFGVSTLHLAAALRDNWGEAGGARLISSEFEPGKVAAARETVTEAGFDDLVEIREGDALDTLARDLPERVDLVLLDGAKGLYPAILDLVEPVLAPGALILADNADWSPDYLARVRDPARGYLSVPFADDVELSIRVDRRG